MEAILSFSWQAVAVVLVLGVLIFIHELGHFLVARFFKIGVITFSLGFGPKILKYKKDKTTYALSLIPLGGYVSMVGEYSDEVENLGFTQEDAIGNRPPFQRLCVAASGPLANILLAFLVYVGIALHSGASVTLPVLGTIVENSAAYEVGLEPNDTILRIGDYQIEEWNDVIEALKINGATTTEIEYSRDNTIYTADVTPKQSVRTNIFGEEEKAYLLGVTPSGEVKHTPLTIPGAFVEGYKQAVFTIDVTLTGLAKLVTGSVSADNVGGPIMIAQVVGQQASVGILPLLMLTALISINLGLLNLLPIPVLDGGTIVFSVIEMITRRPISEKIQNGLMQVGGFLLISLMIFATFNDVMRFFK